MMCGMSMPVDAASITVSAAASLKEAFGQIIQDYQKQYSQDKIRLNTAASGVLLQQLAQGAPVDVLATADVDTMNQAEHKHLIDSATRQNFAGNRLVLITPKKSAMQVKAMTDLMQGGVRKIAIGQPRSVPAGKYAQAVLQQVNLFGKLNSKYVYTQNVRQALDYVVRGEVEAGFVYYTDARLRLSLLNVIPISTSLSINYPVAVTRSSTDALAAKRFVNYVLSSQGQNVLKRFGFEKP